MRNKEREKFSPVIIWLEKQIYEIEQSIVMNQGYNMTPYELKLHQEKLRELIYPYKRTLEMIMKSTRTEDEVERDRLTSMLKYNQPLGGQYNK